MKALILTAVAAVLTVSALASTGLARGDEAASMCGCCDCSTCACDVCECCGCDDGACAC